MAKLSGLTKKERALAERIGGGTIGKGKLSDKMALAVGFVIERRSNPTVGLRAYESSHTADDVRASLEDQPTPRSSGNGDNA